MSSLVTILPIVSTNPALPSVNIGDVVPNFPGFTADPNCTEEWYFGPDLYSLRGISGGAFVAPSGQVGGAAWPTFGTQKLTPASGKNGLLLPYADSAMQTTMLVFKVASTPAAKAGCVVFGNYSDGSGEAADGLSLYYDPGSGSLLLALRSPNNTIFVNAHSAGPVVGDIVFVALAEDAASVIFSYGGSTNPANSVTGPKAVSSRPYGLGNRYFNSASFNTHTDFYWMGRATTKLSSTAIAATYANIKAKFAAFGVTIK